MRLRLPALVAVSLLLTTPALAHPPPGTDLSSSEHAWWECFHPLNGKHNCCSEADGFALSPDNVRQDPSVIGQPIDPPRFWARNAGGIKSGYQIRIDAHGNPGGGPGSSWWDVRKDALIGFEAKSCGLDPKAPADAHVWITREWEGSKLIFIFASCFIAGTVE